MLGKRRRVGHAVLWLASVVAAISIHTTESEWSFAPWTEACTHGSTNVTDDATSLTEIAVKFVYAHGHGQVSPLDAVALDLACSSSYASSSLAAALHAAAASSNSSSCGLAADAGALVALNEAFQQLVCFPLTIPRTSVAAAAAGGSSGSGLCVVRITDALQQAGLVQNVSSLQPGLQLRGQLLDSVCSAMRAAAVGCCLRTWAFFMAALARQLCLNALADEYLSLPGRCQVATGSSGVAPSCFPGWESQLLPLLQPRSDCGPTSEQALATWSGASCSASQLNAAKGASSSNGSGSSSHCFGSTCDIWCGLLGSLNTTQDQQSASAGDSVDSSADKLSKDVKIYVIVISAVMGVLLIVLLAWLLYAANRRWRCCPALLPSSSGQRPQQQQRKLTAADPTAPLALHDHILLQQQHQLLPHVPPPAQQHGRPDGVGLPAAAAALAGAAHANSHTPYMTPNPSFIYHGPPAARTAMGHAHAASAPSQRNPSLLSHGYRHAHSVEVELSATGSRGADADHGADGHQSAAGAGAGSGWLQGWRGWYSWLLGHQTRSSTANATAGGGGAAGGQGTDLRAQVHPHDPGAGAGLIGHVREGMMAGSSSRSRGSDGSSTGLPPRGRPPLQLRQQLLAAHGGSDRGTAAVAGAGGSISGSVTGVGGGLLRISNSRGGSSVWHSAHGSSTSRRDSMESAASASYCTAASNGGSGSVGAHSQSDLTGMAAAADAAP